MTGNGLSRRQALGLIGAGLGGIGVGVTGLWRGWGDGAEPGPVTVSGADLTEPQVLTSQAGMLEFTLTAAAGGVRLGAHTVNSLGYNGSSPGPTWRIRPGDRVRVDLRNGLAEPTNLHVHGLHVSPTGRSDNAFVRVEPGETFGYEYEVPLSHRSGTFWYHPHLHGHVADQVFGGLVGAIVVESDQDQSLPIERERILVVTDISLDETGHVAPVTMMDRMLGREGRQVLVNGQWQPVITIAAGRFERWRIVNACVSRFLRLELDGAELVQIGVDGGLLTEPHGIEEIRLASGSRTDLLVRVPATGTFELASTPVDRGSMGMGRMGRMMGRPPDARTGGTAALATVRSTGSPQTAAALPTRLAAVTDLRNVRVAARRTVTFGMGMRMGGMSFTIDGHEFDHERVDSSAVAGTVEEWTIVNDSPMDHPFHLHVWPFQLVESAGGPVSGQPVWRDVVNVPAQGWVRLRIRFDDFTGRTVYHCHILDHEDNGMMATVRVA